MIEGGTQEVEESPRLEEWVQATSMVLSEMLDTKYEL